MVLVDDDAVTPAIDVARVVDGLLLVGLELLVVVVDVLEVEVHKVVGDVVDVLDDGAVVVVVARVWNR